ncbi:MAG: Holliday junction resolvase RuvX [Lentimicrobiaceae bacterium]|nr:Holliday junction resolvase RuvX [Lentimicrobiaceae bacterium]
MKSAGRIVAVDYGQKRVGIAVTDELQLIANALVTVDAGDIFSFLKEYTQKENVSIFLVGEPKQMDNTHSVANKYIAPFVRKLRAEFPNIPIIRADERFTSKMAFQTMIDAGLGKKARQNKALVDSISAAIMLQTYLESLEYKEETKNDK